MLRQIPWKSLFLKIDETNVHYSNLFKHHFYQNPASKKKSPAHKFGYRIAVIQTTIRIHTTQHNSKRAQANNFFVRTHLLFGSRKTYFAVLSKRTRKWRSSEHSGCNSNTYTNTHFVWTKPWNRWDAVTFFG